VNGDGYADLLIGAPNEDTAGANAGVAYLLLGGGERWPNVLTGAVAYSGTGVGALAGTDVAGVGDIDGDGRDDLLVGAPGADDTGAAYLVLGAVEPASASLADTIVYTGASAGDRAGWAVSGAGDTNGDGTKDLLIGAVGYEGPGADAAGAAFLVLGHGL